MAVTIDEQRYGPTTGAVSGWLALTMCVASGLLLLTNASSGRVHMALALGIAAVLIWCYVLRPRVIIREPDTLLLRNAFSTWDLPLAAVTRVQIKAITRIHLEDTAYDGLGVGRRVMTVVRGASSAPPRPSLSRREPAKTPEGIADLVTEQVLAAAERAQETGQRTAPVRRRWARVELSLLGAQVVALAVLILS